MASLLGSVPGSSSRLAGGLGMVAGLMVSDVTPTGLQRIPPALGTKDNAGITRFRKHLNGLTTDLTNAILPGATVKIFASGTDVLVGSLVSDALGAYDLPVYVDGTFYAWVWKTGSPNVFGGSDLMTPF